jgi:hypothetical protein
MEMSAIYYIDEKHPYFEDWPIYVADTKDPKAFIGIEQAFDMVIEYEDVWKRRFIGTVDGVVYNIPRDRYFLEENKTASRLDEAWRNSFEMSNQVTGYLAISEALLGFQVFDSRVTGAKVKPTNRGEDVYTCEVSRASAAMKHWGNWFRHSVEMYEAFKDNWEDAPRYTHSCNRYFRPCSLISFCCDTPEGRITQWNQMVPADLSPSEKAVLED